MIGYILIGIGAWLVYDDLKQAKKSAKGGPNENLSEIGGSSGSGDPDSKPSTASQKHYRNRGVVKPIIKPETPIGVPAKKKGVSENELFEESIQPRKPDEAGHSTGDDSSGEPNQTSNGRKAASLKGVKENAGNQNNIENGNRNNGDHVDTELSGVNESDGAETD